VIPATVRRGVAGEGARYFAAAAIAFAVDFGSYMGLIHLAGVHYLSAAPLGFALGVATIYALSIRWVFSHRRLADSRMEFALFAAIGIAGMALNQLMIYAGVEGLGLSYALAKILSAAVAFGFNFCARKIFLFTKR
jgi:putative flippase GtrA